MCTPHGAGRSPSGRGAGRVVGEDAGPRSTLVNAGDEEVVSQEEGEREGGAAGGEGGGCCCVSAIAIAHMPVRAHRARARTVLDWVVLR